MITPKMSNKERRKNKDCIQLIYAGNFISG